MAKANDLEGAQDMGGKHGGQRGMQDPAPRPGTDQGSSADQGIVRDQRGEEQPAAGSAIQAFRQGLDIHSLYLRAPDRRRAEPSIPATRKRTPAGRVDSSARARVPAAYTDAQIRAPGDA